MDVSDPIVLQRKAQKLRKETGDERWVAPSEKIQRSVASAIGHSLLRPFQLLIFEPMCLNLCIFSAILLGILYLFFGAFPLVFISNHGFNLWQVGLAFLGIGVGSVIAVATDPVWYRIRGSLTRKLEEETGVEGASEPEFRLPPVIVGAVLVPVGIFMFGWTTYSSVHWIVPIIGSTIFGTGYVQKPVSLLHVYTAYMLAFVCFLIILVCQYPGRQDFDRPPRLQATEPALGISSGRRGWGLPMAFVEESGVWVDLHGVA